MLYHSYYISIHEVPGEVAIVFNISQCPNSCVGCHSLHLREDCGSELTKDLLHDLLSMYSGLLTCVCFMGGEWAKSDLTCLLDETLNTGIKTCLYTKETKLPESIVRRLTYAKIGEYIESLGGLDIETTNQKFFRISDMYIMNHLFRSNA